MIISHAKLRTNKIPTIVAVSALAIAFLAIGGIAIAQQSGTDMTVENPTVRAYESKRGGQGTGIYSETISTLATNGVPVVAQSAKLEDLQAGEILDVNQEIAVTNDTGRTVNTGAMIVLASSPTETSGTVIAPNNGLTITPSMHHWAFAKSGNLNVAQPLGTRYVNVVLTAYPPAGSALRVDQGLGYLNVMRYTPQ